MPRHRRPPPARPSRQPLYGFIVLGILGALVATIVTGPNVLLTGPAPYRVPRTFGGTALRLAMVHDVLHERYPRHGAAYYEHRVEKVRRRLAEVDLDAGAKLDDLARLDDLSAALDHLGRPDEAIEVQRRKLRILQTRHPESLADVPPPFFDDAACRGVDGTQEAMRRLSQPDPGPARMSAYRTHANLGTHLIHASIREALSGDAAARTRLEEGLQHIRTAIGIRPGAHFGREEWQVNAVETLLAQSGLAVMKVDLAGTALDRELPWASRRRGLGLSRGGGPLEIWYTERAAVEGWMAGTPADARESGLAPAARLRRAISRVNVGRYVRDEGEGSIPWPAASRYPDGVPFDEPTLAILGMWMLGGGPNPQSALAIGGIMEQVGQRHLAWSAYARALELGGEAFALADRCHERMRVIEKSLAADGGPRRAQLQAQFNKELAEGRAWQAAYQAYEAERISAGADPTEPGFYAAFHADHGPIATPPGPEDTLRILTHYPPGLLRFGWARILLGAGIGAFLGSLVGPRKR